MVTTSDSGGGGGVPTSIGGKPVSAAGKAVMGAVSGGLLGALEIVLDAAQIAAINAHLQEAQDSIDQARSKVNVAIPASSVGGSPVGHQLAHHSKLADEALAETLQRMEAGIIYYRDAIKIAVADLTGADEASAATAKKGESQFSPTTGVGS